MFITLGLEHRPTTDQRAGIWNGNEFVFEESKWELISLAKLLYKYGIQTFNLNRYSVCSSKSSQSHAPNRYYDNTILFI